MEVQWKSNVGDLDFLVAWSLAGTGRPPKVTHTLSVEAPSPPSYLTSEYTGNTEIALLLLLAPGRNRDTQQLQRTQQKNKKNTWPLRGKDWIDWDRLPFWSSDPVWRQKQPTSWCSHQTDCTLAGCLGWKQFSLKWVPCVQGDRHFSS